MMMVATLAMALWSASADAKGVVYVNGVKADTLANFDFKDVNVRIDENGDVWIDGAQYHISVDQKEADKNAAAQAGLGVGIDAGKYWLVTQDNQSTGHTLEVVVNGLLVRRIKSGDPQLILDLQPYLKVGINNITVNALPGGTPGGGAIFVYVGTGSNLGGTVQLDKPEITYMRRSSDSADGGAKAFNYSVKATSTP